MQLPASLYSHEFLLHLSLSEALYPRLGLSPGLIFSLLASVATNLTMRLLPSTPVYAYKIRSTAGIKLKYRLPELMAKLQRDLGQENWRETAVFSFGQVYFLNPDKNRHV